MRKIFSVLLSLTLLLSPTLTVSAQNMPQERNDCSIEVIVRHNGQNVSGGTLTAVKVGYVDELDGGYCFRRVTDDVLLEDIQAADAAVKLQEFCSINEDNYDFYKQTVNVIDGKGTFQNLSTGLYVIIQDEAADGYSELNAFLVSVPYMENEEYQYNVTAKVKSELEREDVTEDTPDTEPDDPKLPQTGQLKWPIPLMLVSGLVLFTIGVMLRFERKKEYYEK